MKVKRQSNKNNYGYNNRYTQDKKMLNVASET